MNEKWWKEFLLQLIDDNTLIIVSLLILTAVYTIATRDKQLAPLVASGLIGYMGKTVQSKNKKDSQ